MTVLTPGGDARVSPGVGVSCGAGPPSDAAISPDVGGVVVADADGMGSTEVVAAGVSVARLKELVAPHPAVITPATSAVISQRQTGRARWFFMARSIERQLPFPTIARRWACGPMLSARFGHGGGPDPDPEIMQGSG